MIVQGARGTSDRFSLLGGPVHRLACRMGLVRDGANTVGLGVALGLSLWVMLVALALIEGAGPRLFSLSLLGAHVRLLAVIPLFFLCESRLDPCVAAFVEILARTGIVRDEALPAYATEVARSRRLTNSRVTEAACAVAALLMLLTASRLHRVGLAMPSAVEAAGSRPTAAGLWYWLVCLTLLRFLVFRWLSRLVIWALFLWRVARFDLHLTPTHPDGAGGLGYLEVVHMQFAPLVVAISALQAAGIAEQFSARSVAASDAYHALAFVLIFDATVFLAPLFIFSRSLVACRVAGLDDYMTLAARYVSAFDRKWVRTPLVSGQVLLGTPDLQSLADLSTSVQIVRDMRIAPVSARLLWTLATAALAPLLPLLLFRYPIEDLASAFLARLTGL